MEALKAEIESTEEQFPPLWSGDVKELGKFATDIEEWVKSPKVKHARQLVEALRKQARDNRSFAGLAENFLLNVLDELENGVTCVSKIGEEKLRSGAAKKILSALLEQSDIASLIAAIAEYSTSFDQLASAAVNNEFAETVKGDLLDSLAKVEDFSRDRINKAHDELRKAAEAVNLLQGSGIPAQAYVKAYKGSKSVDDVWALAQEIRMLLPNTNIQATQKLGDPFNEVTAIVSARQESVRRANLAEVGEGLRQVLEKLKSFREKLEGHVRQEYERARRLVEFAQINDQPVQVYEELVRNIGISLNIDEIYARYEELEQIKQRAVQALEGRISKQERRIIESMDKVDEIADEMGEDFWKALKSLRSQGLIKVLVARAE
ncbi:hypothetical protein M1N58_00100 [Dehalococcoidales bacterium]|nr:hypothetical protein [Dehalococcoidales bacterium]